MRFVQRNLWPCLALLLTGCSLVVDFPEPRDAGVGAGEGGRPSNCDLATHDGCMDDELCCPVPDGRKKACLPKTAERCTSCGSEGACTDPAANRCGKERCECEPGSGQACSGDMRCSTATDKPPTCVGCDVDKDCKSLGDTAQCVDHECRLCDQGDPNIPTDDVGCPANSPICDENGQCVGCDSDKDCGDGRRCVEGQGCFGCSISAPIGNNGCTSPTLPVCKRVGGDFQCEKCTNDAECMSGNYCDEITGACTPTCNPGGPFGSNGCTVMSRGFCKQSTSGGYECQACSSSSVPPDCTGSKPYCFSTAGHSLRGQCVQCRSSTDCPSGLLCDPGSLSCRSLMPTDCPPATPVLMGSMCVQCTNDTHCGTMGLPAYCNTSTNTCVSCTSLTPSPDAGCAAKPGGRPYCGTAGLCVQCTSPTHCSTTMATPICSATNTCTTCTTNAQCAAAYPSMNRGTCVLAMTGVSLPTPITSGSCWACNPALPSDNGCPATSPDCRLVNNVPTCMSCTPTACTSATGAPSTPGR